MTRHAVLSTSRAAVARQQILPDFIVIGAMRAGTTSLHDLLAEHPEVGMPRIKEVDYFLPSRCGRGIEWYSGHWQEGRVAHGEVSPNYSKVDVFPGVARRIASTLPDVRLVYIVRDPVDRFVSQYWHMRARGFRLPEPGPMCASEPDLPPEPVRLGLDEPYRHILSVSSYARQLGEYRRYVPAERIRIVDFAEVLSDPARTLADLQRFLGLAIEPLRLPERNGSCELTRVPLPLLRLARDTALGRRVTRAVSGRSRDRLKRLLAMPFRADRPAFPEAALERIRKDLAADVASFRAMTGMAFAHWSV